MANRAWASTNWLQAAAWLCLLGVVISLSGTLRPRAEYLGGLPLRRLLASTTPILRANPGAGSLREARSDALLRGDPDAADALDANLVQLVRAGADPLALVAAMRGFADAVNAPTDAASEAVQSDTLHPLTRDGAFGAALAAATARNLARLDPELRRVLESLVGAVERAASIARGEGCGDSKRRAAAARLAQSFARQAAPAAADLDLAAAVDVDGIARAAEGMLRAGEAARAQLATLSMRANGLAVGLEALPAGDAWPHDLVLALTSRAGPILVCSTQTSVIPLRGIAAVIDLGGDDLFTDEGVLQGIADEPRAAVLVLDVAGDDRFRCARGGLGAGIGGIAVLVDGEGRDTYETDGPGIGAAFLGAAFVVDHAGDDRYDATRCAFGAAAFGCAALVDLEGDDRYQAEGFALGAAGAGGQGALLDAGGYDLVIVAPPKGLAADSPCIALGAVDNSESLPPGVGLFYDRKGDDIVRVASGCLGFARGCGLGLALDAYGDDVVSAGDWCLGAAQAHGFALYRDLMGCDRVVARRRSLGFACDALAFSIDDAGEDERVSLAPARGASESDGSGVFADLNGAEH